MRTGLSGLVTRAFALAACAAIGLSGGCENKGGAKAPPTRVDGGETRSAGPTDPATAGYIASAEQAIRDGDLDKALQEFARAIEVNPNSTTAHLGMADIYRMKGDYSRAETRYARASALEPRNFDAQYFHGLMLHLLDRLPDAIQAYIRALTLRPTDFKANPMNAAANDVPALTN